MAMRGRERRGTGPCRLYKAERQRKLEEERGSGTRPTRPDPTRGIDRCVLGWDGMVPGAQRPRCSRWPHGVAPWTRWSAACPRLLLLLPCVYGCAHPSASRPHTYTPVAAHVKDTGGTSAATCASRRDGAARISSAVSNRRVMLLCLVLPKIRLCSVLVRDRRTDGSARARREDSDGCRKVLWILLLFANRNESDRVRGGGNLLGDSACPVAGQVPSRSTHCPAAVCPPTCSWPRLRLTISFSFRA